MVSNQTKDDSFFKLFCRCDPPTHTELRLTATHVSLHRTETSTVCFTRGNHPLQKVPGDVSSRHPAFHVDHHLLALMVPGPTYRKT